MKCKISFSLLLLMVSTILFSQTDPNNLPKPPTAELEKFKPSLGKWEITADYGGSKWNGTLEFKPAIKGWYIERTILIKSTDGKIDREFKAMITWDPEMKQYRVWRFETVPPAQMNEMSGRFNGSEFVEEMEAAGRDGTKSTFRNRWIFTNSNELQTITELIGADGKIIPIGVTTAKRVLK